MTKRQSLHPDNDIIDAMQEGDTPSQGSRSGGEVNRRVGTRDELARVTDPDNREPATGQDNPSEDAEKGPKTRHEIQQERNDS